MKVEWWPKVLNDVPRAIVLRGKRSKVVIEFGRTSFLPFQVRQVFKSRFLSVQYDPQVWRDHPRRTSIHSAKGTNA